MPTPRSPNPLSDFAKSPVLGAKGGRITLSTSGQAPRTLFEALKQVDAQLSKTKEASEVKRLNKIKEILSSLQTQGEAKLRQLPPTERGLASLAKAAALKREKRVVEDKDRPSGHFTKQFDPDALAPRDAAAVRARKQAEAKGKIAPRGELPTPERVKKLGPRETAAIRAGAKASGIKGRKFVTGGSLKEGGPVISARQLLTKGLENPEVSKMARTSPQEVESATDRLLRKLTAEGAYRESLGGSLERASAIENLQPEAFTELRKEASKIVSKLGDKPTKTSVQDVKDYFAKVKQAIKDEQISKELGDSLRNRLTEQLMTSGAGDAVLGALSNTAGKGRYQTETGEVKPRTGRGKNLGTLLGPNPLERDPEMQLAARRKQALMEAPSRRGGASVRLPKRERVDTRAMAAQILKALLEKGTSKRLPISRPYVPSTGGDLVRILSQTREPVPPIEGPPGAPEAPSPLKVGAVKPLDMWEFLQRMHYRGGRTPFKA